LSMVNCYLCHKPIKVSAERHLFDEKLKKRMHIRCFAGPCSVCDTAVAKWNAVKDGNDVYHKGCWRKATLKKRAKENPTHMKRARDKQSRMWLWHSKDGGKLYECSQSPHYYLCDICQDFVGANSVSATWENRPPGADVPDEDEFKTNPPAGERWLTEEELQENPEFPVAVVNPGEGYYFSECQPGYYRYARKDGQGKICLFPAKSEAEAREMAEKMYREFTPMRKNIAPLVVAGAMAAAPIVAEEAPKVARSAGKVVKQVTKRKNPPKCAGCHEPLTMLEFQHCCVTDDSGTYHAWCYPDMKKLIAASMEKVGRENPARPTKEFWDRVYPQVYAGYLKRYRPETAEKLARAATGAIWYRKMSPKRRKEFEKVREARENVAPLVGAAVPLVKEEMRLKKAGLDSAKSMGIKFGKQLRKMRENPRAVRDISPPKFDVSKVRNYYLVASNGAIIARGSGSPTDAEAHRLRLHREDDLNTRVIWPDDLYSAAVDAKSLLG